MARKCPHCNGTGRVIVLSDEPDAIPLCRMPRWPKRPKTMRCGVCGGDGLIDAEDIFPVYDDWCKTNVPTTKTRRGP